MRTVEFGWGAPTLAEQFPELSPEKVATLQKIHNSMLTLSIHGLLTESERSSVQRRLVKMISVAVMNVNRMEGRR